MKIKMKITNLDGTEVTLPQGVKFKVEKIQNGVEWTKPMYSQEDINYYDLAIMVGEIGKTGKYRFILRHKGMTDTFGVCNLIAS